MELIHVCVCVYVCGGNGGQMDMHDESDGHTVKIFTRFSAELRKATVNFAMYVRPYETARLPLDGFS